jgi:hypothetical protein
MHLPGRLRLVRLPHQYRGAHRRSLPQWPRARSPQARPDWSAGRPRAPALSHGMHGISQVPGQPLCARPALGPRGGRRAQPSQRADAADTFQTAPAHPNLSFRGSITRLSHSLSTLRGPDHPGSRARLASGWWLACAGQMLPLLGRSGRFPCHGSSATFPPPPGFAWRDRNDITSPLPGASACAGSSSRPPACRRRSPGRARPTVASAPPAPGTSARAG